jgi:hypothetical protein
MVGELTFFLGIQVKQTKEGTFVHQVKYTKDLMKMFNMTELKPVSTPMNIATVLDPDENDKAIDQRRYRSIIHPPVPHGDMTGHSVRGVHAFKLSCCSWCRIGVLGCYVDGIYTSHASEELKYEAYHVERGGGGGESG